MLVSSIWFLVTKFYRLLFKFFFRDDHLYFSIAGRFLSKNVRSILSCSNFRLGSGCGLEVDEEEYFPIRFKGRLSPWENTQGKNNLGKTKRWGWAVCALVPYIFYAVSLYGFTKAKRNNNDNLSMDMTVETPSALGAVKAQWFCQQQITCYLV